MLYAAVRLRSAACSSSASRIALKFQVVKKQKGKLFPTSSSLLLCALAYRTRAFLCSNWDIAAQNGCNLALDIDAVLARSLLCCSDTPRPYCPGRRVPLLSWLQASSITFTERTRHTRIALPLLLSALDLSRIACQFLQPSRCFCIQSFASQPRSLEGDCFETQMAVSSESLPSRQAWRVRRGAGVLSQPATGRRGAKGRPPKNCIRKVSSHESRRRQVLTSP